MTLLGIHTMTISYFLQPLEVFRLVVTLLRCKAKLTPLEREFCIFKYIHIQTHLSQVKSNNKASCPLLYLLDNLALKF